MPTADGLWADPAGLVDAELVLPLATCAFVDFARGGALPVPCPRHTHGRTPSAYLCAQLTRSCLLCSGAAATTCMLVLPRVERTFDAARDHAKWVLLLSFECVCLPMSLQASTV